MQCYPPTGEKPGKREQVEAMFNAIAPRYDLLNRVLSFGIDRRWRLAAVRALGTESAGRILDVATGTGDLAFEVLRLHTIRRSLAWTSRKLCLQLRAKKLCEEVCPIASALRAATQKTCRLRTACSTRHWSPLAYATSRILGWPKGNSPGVAARWPTHRAGIQSAEKPHVHVRVPALHKTRAAAGRTDALTSSRCIFLPARIDSCLPAW